MAGLSKYLALALFNNTLNPVRASFAPPEGLYLALHTAAPNDDTYGNEATYTAYARQAVNSLTATLQAGSGGNVDVVVTNGSAILFPASTGSTGQTVTHWALWDSQAVGAGNILYSGALSASRLVTSGDKVVVPEGGLAISLK